MAQSTSPGKAPPRDPRIPPTLATVTLQGTLLQVIVNLPHYRKEPPKRRRAIVGFTRPARLRMLKTIARIDWRNVGRSLLITLTYPDDLTDRTYKERSADRTKFMMGLEVIVGRPLAGLWRTEWVTRKSGAREGQLAPHHHIVVMRCAWVDWREVRHLWARTIGWQGYVATNVRGTFNGEHAARYAAKYAAKAEVVSSLDYASYLQMTGRHWGMMRKPLIPWAKEHNFTDCAREHIERAMEVAAQLLGRSYVGSFFALTKLAEAFYRRILGKRNPGA